MVYVKTKKICGQKSGAEKYERTIREEGREERKAKLNKLGILMGETGRSDEFLKFLSDLEFQRKLLIEFGQVPLDAVKSWRVLSSPICCWKFNRMHLRILVFRMWD